MNTTVFGYGLRANAGVRYFSTDLTSAGMLNTGSALVPVSIVHHYNDFLPAANVAVDFSDEFVGRFSINRNISRPALSDLAAAGTLTTRPTGGSISAGNPNLKPFMADSIEASLDYFEGHSGYASVGVFYKNMESFITTTTKQVPYNTTGYSPTFLLPGEDPSTLFDYSAPINGKGAVIAGVEFAVQKDFDFLPAPFDHFGRAGQPDLCRRQYRRGLQRNDDLPAADEPLQARDQPHALLRNGPLGRAACRMPIAANISTAPAAAAISATPSVRPTISTSRRTTMSTSI